MKSALEIIESRRLKREQKIKENAELVNKELLELEKILNKYENNIEDENLYITVPIIIRTNEVKQLLEEKGYIIDKVSNDIEYGTTRIWIDKDDYLKETKDNPKDKEKVDYDEYMKKYWTPIKNNPRIVFYNN